MRKILFIVALSFLTISLSAQTYELDSSNSSIQWTGKKLTGKHNGEISFTSGTINKADDSFNSGSFIVDMTSITCVDIEDAEVNAQLVGHLKSDDFFGVGNYPTAQLTIAKGTPLKDGGYEFTGNITIKNKTEPISFKVSSENNSSEIIFVGKLTIDRSKFDVRYGSGSFFDNLGDNLIYDNFELDFNVVLKK